MAANPRMTHDLAVARAEALAAAAEQLAASSQHEQAYVRLRAAVGSPPRPLGADSGP